MVDTVFALSTLGVPLYAARGLTQTLDPIEASKQYGRTIDGALVDLSVSQFRKYRSTVTCSDQRPLALDGIFPGQVYTVDCVAELSYKTSGGSPARTPVAASSYTEGDYTFYRPQLSMMITSYSEQVDEYGAVVSWTLELEEV